MSEVEKKIAKEAYDIDRRKWIDQRRKKRVKSLAEVEIVWTGVCTSTLRKMNDVENGTRLAVGQTFPNRDLITLRTAEEANLRGIYVTILRARSSRFVHLALGFTSVLPTPRAAAGRFQNALLVRGTLELTF
jgi:hypothetical protein